MVSAEELKSKVYLTTLEREAVTRNYAKLINTTNTLKREIEKLENQLYEKMKKISEMSDVINKQKRMIINLYEEKLVVEGKLTDTYVDFIEYEERIKDLEEALRQLHEKVQEVSLDICFAPGLTLKSCHWKNI